MNRWDDPDLDATIYVDLCTPDDPTDYADEDDDTNRITP